MGNSLARGAAMSVRFGRFSHRVIVRCLQRGGRCGSTLSEFPGNVLASEEVAATSEEAVATSDKAVATSDADGELSTPEVEKKIRKRSLCLPTVFLPPELRSALELVLSRHPSSNLIEDSQDLARYLRSRQAPSKVDESRRRKGEVKVVPGDSWTNPTQCKEKETVHTAIRYGKREAIAYAASRLPATYGTTLRVFSEIARHVPSFQPETLLDFGSGLGTAGWAAHQLWSKSMKEYQFVDTSQEMLDMARVLLAGGKELDPVEENLGLAETQKTAIPGVYFRQYLPVSNKVKYDIVVASYSLEDVPAVKLRRMSLASLWRKTKQFLVLIEPGSDSGFRNIIEARDMILNAVSWKDSELGTEGGGDQEGKRNNLEGHVFAPCPHDLKCPLMSKGHNTLCHFAQRVQLAFCEKKTLKHKGFHIEGFSYIVMRKGKRPEDPCSKARLLQPVRKRTRHILCKLCCPDGNIKEQLILTKKKHKELYKEGRKSEWGDLLPLPPDKTPDNNLL